MPAQIRSLKPRIAVLGSSNTDMIVLSARIPRPGETILGGQFLTAAGGKGANQAVAAARAGGEVEFIGRVGADALGRAAIQGLKRDGIETRHVSQDPKIPSGVALIMVSKIGENAIAVAPGANGNLSPADLSKAAAAIAEAEVLVLQLETPLRTVCAAARVACRESLVVILNPAPVQELPDSLLKHVDILTPNETEAELLTGIQVNSEANAVAAADRLLARGVRSVVITLGSRGALVASGQLRKLVPAFKVKPVDTTAAGDVFNGALAVAVAQGKSIVDAVRFASAAAAISVTRLGAQPSAPRRHEIELLLRRRPRAPQPSLGLR